ncbi:MAG: hypothetical protein ACE37F_02830 [Nannocystaceae bacterium]|nr:thioredoxin family protein [bacterium]
MPRALALVCALVLLPACEQATDVPTGRQAAVDDIDALRREGRAALTRLLERDAPAELIDAVAQQRDASASGLYWETELETALSKARERGVPVLSLRMLGGLTDEYSCANSRFFRTLLYTDPELSQFLDERFVLHWSTERPVPQVQIDFGDGRIIHTTTTGNSAHYVLDHAGRVLDVLPGLYDARTFRERLEGVFELHAATLRAPDERDALIAAHHRAAAAALEGRLATIMTPALRAWMIRPPGQTDDEPVPALDAQRFTMSKSMVEVPTLRALERAPTFRRDSAEQALRETLKPAVFSAQAIALVRRDRPRRDAESHEDYDARIARLLAAAADNVAMDTALNEARLHYQIHQWYIRGEVDGAFASLNERIYTELFATPPADPWLGLLDDTVYDGLPEVPNPARG